MPEAVVILNPAARSTRAKRLQHWLAKLPDCKLLYTGAAGDGEILARKAISEGHRTIVAAGGDGTVNDVANGVAGTDATLGVLPAGTMNVFAAELGIPTNPAKAWNLIQSGQTRSIDLAKANGRHFVQLAGVGFDAQVVESTTWQAKRSFGPLSYVFSAAKIASRIPPQLSIRANGYHFQGCLVLVGNGRFYGGPVPFFQDARIDDGKLDVLIFKRMSHIDLARYVGSLFMGRHTELSDVEYFQSSEVSVTCPSTVPYEADGELIGNAPVTFSMAPGALKVIAPGGS